MKHFGHDPATYFEENHNFDCRNKKVPTGRKRKTKSAETLNTSTESDSEIIFKTSNKPKSSIRRSFRDTTVEMSTSQIDSEPEEGEIPSDDNVDDSTETTAINPEAEEISPYEQLRRDNIAEREAAYEAAKAAGKIEQFPLFKP